MKSSGGFQADDPWPSNRWFNELADRASRRCVLASTDPSIERTRAGLGRARSPRVWAKITGSGPAYPWSEAIAQTGGGFGLLAQGRSDDSGRQPAYEINGKSVATGTFVQIRYTTAGDWRFQEWKAGSSSGSGGGGTTGTIPSCFCTAIPTTLRMTSSSETCNYGMFRSCTIQYGPVPSAYAALDLGPNAFISLQSFPDPLAGGALFQYLLGCQYNQFSLTRLYAESPFGSPYRDGVLFTWFVGSYGNSCTPFHLDNGIGYPGGDPTCYVMIDTTS